MPRCGHSNIVTWTTRALPERYDLGWHYCSVHQTALVHTFFSDVQVMCFFHTYSPFPIWQGQTSCFSESDPRGVTSCDPDADQRRVTSCDPDAVHRVTMLRMMLRVLFYTWRPTLYTTPYHQRNIFFLNSIV